MKPIFINKNMNNNFDELIQKIIQNATKHEDGFTVSEAEHNGKLGEVTPHVQMKKWGWELWLVYIKEKYALKILHVNKGHRLSLQSHSNKEESWLVIKGAPELILGEETVKGGVGKMYHIPVGTVHRISAIEEDIEILEISTHELWDVNRLEDDYGRK